MTNFDSGDTVWEHVARGFIFTTTPIDSPLDCPMIYLVLSAKLFKTVGLLLNILHLNRKIEKACVNVF